MFRIVLSCLGIPPQVGDEAAKDITQEFADHRPWHKNVKCTWDGLRLLLSAENDYDSNGLALLDEFGDCIAAYVGGQFDSEVKVESVENSNA